MNNDNFISQCTDSISFAQQSNYCLPASNAVSFIFEYKTERKWAKVNFPYNYELFEAKGNIAQFQYNIFFL